MGWNRDAGKRKRARGLKEEMEGNIVKKLPWLVWLGGLSTCLRTTGSLVQFPVRAHAWVVGQVPSGGGGA